MEYAEFTPYVEKLPKRVEVEPPEERLVNIAGDIFNGIYSTTDLNNLPKD